MPVSKSLVEHVSLIREVVISTVEAMPEDKLGYTPGENCRPFRDIALHIAKARWNLSNMLSGQTDAPARGFQAGTKAELLALLREGQEQCRRVLAAVTEDQLTKVHTVGIGERTGLDVVHLMLMHEADHHGNLVVLAKLCGVSPPDLREASKAALAKA
ncbi:MAG TPA: DinB family protein [Candidatus Xenobia bacterium]|jgi:uncharacterized damage-inducible protein DinB